MASKQEMQEAIERSRRVGRVVTHKLARVTAEASDARMLDRLHSPHQSPRPKGTNRSDRP
jgi:hypothetical protein